MTWTLVRSGAPGHRGASIFGPHHGRRVGPADAARDDNDNGDTEPNETEEVEVLETQLTREDQPSGSGPRGTGVALIAILVVPAVLATTGGARWGRHS